MDVRRRFLGLNKKKVDPGYNEDAYSVNLNDQWRLSETIPNPDPELYEGVYESFSNYNVSNSCAKMTITIKDLDEFTIYVRSYSETYYDYVMVSQLDVDINENTSYLYGDAVKSHTRTSQSSGTDIYNYIPVTYTNIGGGEHTITIIYRKDESGNYNDDRGYVLIERIKNESPDEPGEEFSIDNYLTFEALEDNLSVSLSMNNCEYCIDGSNSWVTLYAGSYTPNINTGQTISFRATGLTPSSTAGIGTFTSTKFCNLKGNCMSMLFGDNAANNYSLSEYNYAFYKLFNNNTTIKSVSKTFLPAMALSNNCYYYMFYGCSNLTQAPDLPASTLMSSCYYYMFYKCTSLTTGPTISATTTGSYSCYGMFYGCSNLTQAPTLPATTLGYMCYYYMFSGCTSLTTAPVLPAKTLTGYCYYYMFNGCTKLNYIKMLATDVSAGGCLSYWVYNVSSTGTFVKSKDATWTNTGYSGVPNGWTIITE